MTYPISLRIFVFKDIGRIGEEILESGEIKKADFEGQSRIGGSDIRKLKNRGAKQFDD